MLTVYRTVKANYVDQPLAAEGARLFGGRWNPKGFGVLYSTSSPALALIESSVHQPQVNYGKLPRLVLFTLAVPDNITTYSVGELPAYWNEASYERTQWILSDWLKSPATLVAAVPSMAVPMSFNYLLHPAHADFEQVQIVRQEPFPIERRLWRDSNLGLPTT